MKKYNFFYIIIFIVIVGWWMFVRTENNTVKINGQQFQVEIAADEESRIRGLSGRDELLPDHGMLFIFPGLKVAEFWMKDMKFAIDLLWISDNKIVGYEKNMLVPEPNTLDQDLQRYVSPVMIDKVLEIPAGSIEEYHIKVGDIINTSI